MRNGIELRVQPANLTLMRNNEEERSGDKKGCSGEVSSSSSTRGEN